MWDPEVVGSNTGRSNTHGRSRGYCLGYSEFAFGEIVACGKCKQIFLAKKRSSEFFHVKFSVISQFHALVYLAFANQREEPLFFWAVVLHSSHMRGWASQNTDAGRVLQVLAISSLLYLHLHLLTPSLPMRRGSSNT